MPRTLTLALPAFVLLVLAVPGEPDSREEPPRLPALGELNRHVLDVVATYPTDGTHRYHWPRAGAWAGNVRTLRYGGEVLLEGDPEGRCHCCGLTFEVFFQAFAAWCREVGHPFRILDLDREGVLALKDGWFGSGGNRKTILAAVTRHGLGVRIEALEDARAGDFVQLWRHSGSGHSVVFQRWVRDDEGGIVGLTYWSTQASTNGIGRRTERFGDEGSAVKRDEIYVVRIGEATE